MSETEGKDDQGNNGDEGNQADQNNSQSQGDGGNEGEGIKLSGLFDGATAEQREQYGEYLQGFSKLPDLITEHMNLRAKADGSISKPGEDATDEEKAAYNELLGIPGTAEEYELGVPEGQEPDKELDGWFRDLAVKTGLSKDQANMQFEAFNKLIADGNKAIEDNNIAAKKEVEKELRKDYGKEYEANMAKAGRFMKILGVPDILTSINQTGLENDPRFAKIFVTMGQLISEDSLSKAPIVGGTPKKKSQAEIMYG